MGEPRVYLRPGLPEDVDRVFEWANDPVTRKVSFNTGPVPYAGHVAWFATQLESDQRNLFIAMDGDEPVALVRLDQASGDRSCIVSINVAPSARGRGIGTRVLVAAGPVAATLGFERVDAYIRPSNVASIRAFEKAGYALADPSESLLPGDAVKYVFDLPAAGRG